MTCAPDAIWILYTGLSAAAVIVALGLRRWLETKGKTK